MNFKFLTGTLLLACLISAQIVSSGNHKKKSAHNGVKLCLLEELAFFVELSLEKRTKKDFSSRIIPV